MAPPQIINLRPSIQFKTRLYVSPVALSVQPPPSVSTPKHVSFLSLSLHRNKLSLLYFLKIHSKPEHINYYRTFHSPISHKRSLPLGKRCAQDLTQYNLQLHEISVLPIPQQRQRLHIQQILRVKLQESWDSPTVKQVT